MVKGVSRNHQKQTRTTEPKRGAIKSAAMTEFVVSRSPKMGSNPVSLKSKKMTLGSKSPTDKKVYRLGLTFLGKKH